MSSVWCASACQPVDGAAMALFIVAIKRAYWSIVCCLIRDTGRKDAFYFLLLPGGFAATAVRRPIKHGEFREHSYQAGANQSADPGDRRWYAVPNPQREEETSNWGAQDQPKNPEAPAVLSPDRVRGVPELTILTHPSHQETLLLVTPAASTSLETWELEFFPPLFFAVWPRNLWGRSQFLCWGEST